MLNQTVQQKILLILKELPPDKLHEVIDFAEYLKSKTAPAKTVKKPLHAAIPTFHLGDIEKGALDRGALYGEYLASKFD